ncbi:hypothetical protein EZV77_02810 [Burkholderia thailandensis]|nr:hypothetical protein [Burkholderia thailandensis]MDD1489630.1 hypothetical protein [Burkholderia thailandensis]MDD1495704.1 hypothetical protein [Burkholderia thailandensis]TBW67093.1 hypothetical protein EZV77_02810 [Burkholderia thailandensis]TGB30387.1 hypothetical protein C6946_28800 [Burkholderia thailandensis]
MHRRPPTRTAIAADERDRTAAHLARRRRGMQSRHSDSAAPVFNWLRSTRLVFSNAVIPESRPAYIENIIE